MTLEQTEQSENQQAPALAPDEAGAVIGPISTGTVEASEATGEDTETLSQEDTIANLRLIEGLFQKMVLVLYAQHIGEPGQQDLTENQKSLDTFFAESMGAIRVTIQKIVDRVNNFQK